MTLINNSQDVLYIIISLSVLGLTFFICWVIYYLAMILKQSFQVVKEMRDRLHKIDGIINAVEGVIHSLKEKIDHGASYLFLIGEGVKKLIEIMKGREEKKKKTKKEI